MSKTIRYTLLSLRDLAVSAGPFILLAVALLVLAYWWLDPNPPKRVTLATGPAQSAYEEFGKRYAKILAEDGIKVTLLPSQGSAHNLQLLREGKADLGFVQGGTSEARPEDEENLESLGSLFVEPVWLFYREDAVKKIPPALVQAPTGREPLRKEPTLNALSQLQGWRVNLGTAGSGIPNLMNKLLASNKVDLASLKISELEQTPATVAFLAGDLDAIVFASAPESLMVQMLLQTPGMRLDELPAERGLFAPLFFPERRWCCRAAWWTWRPTSRRATCAWWRPPPRWSSRKGTHPRCCSSSCRPATRSTAAPAGSSGPVNTPTATTASCRSLLRPSAPSRTTSRAAALPALLGGQPGRAHVAGDGHHHRHHAAAVAHHPAAVRLSRALAHLPLVRPVARH
jgi:hypothetical protein